MKSNNTFIDSLVIGALRIGSISTILFAIIVFCSIIFNFKPFIEKGSFAFGITDFKRGIPVQINLNSNAELPDTILHYSSIKNQFNGTEKIYKSSSILPRIKKSFVLDGSVTIDTFLLNQNIHKFITEEKSGIIYSNAFKLTQATIYVGATKMYSKILFILPLVLEMFFWGFCCWHFASFLDSIKSGESFIANNVKRLNKIGLAFIAFQVLNISFSYVLYHFSAGISLKNNGFTILDFSGAPDYSLSLTYSFIGVVILILAKAFKRGCQIQQEQDLTI
jgi:hypothetical protein